MDGCNTTFLLGRPIFRGYVSFREGMFFVFFDLASQPPKSTPNLLACMILSLNVGDRNWRISIDPTYKYVANQLRQRIHVWYIYLQLPWKSTIHVGKYTSPMDPMGIGLNPNRQLNNIRGVVKFRVRNISWSVSKSKNPKTSLELTIYQKLPPWTPQKIHRKKTRKTPEKMRPQFFSKLQIKTKQFCRVKLLLGCPRKLANG